MIAIERYLVSRLASIFAVCENKVSVIKKLEGGYSNQTYLCAINDSLYTYRIKNDFSMTDYENEYLILDLIKDYKITNELIYFDPIKGEKISKYIDGDAIDIDYDLESVSNILHDLHQIKVNVKAFCLDIEEYERFNKEYEFPLKYVLIKDKYKELSKDIKIEQSTLCHNDFQPGNIIKGNKLYLIDFELAAINDPFYDIASFGSFNHFDKSILLLKTYLGREPKLDEVKKLYILRIFQTLKWYNIALFKEKKGLSVKLGVDFIGMAKSLLEISEKLLKELQKL